jgi:mono/diheme cytochrome c family protein
MRQLPAGKVKRVKTSQEGLNMKTMNSMRLVWGMTLAATFALSTPAYSAADAGKATFNGSCIHCHGKNAAGNPSQDRYWKMRIPRLNEAYVQNKSDEELKNVIMNGIRKMPPALMGHPHAADRTKVKPEAVPDLIAYIRSLKKK